MKQKSAAQKVEPLNLWRPGSDEQSEHCMLNPALNLSVAHQSLYWRFCANTEFSDKRNCTVTEYSAQPRVPWHIPTSLLQNPGEKGKECHLIEECR